MPPRSADPYHDLDVIDARAPRTNQAVIGVLALVAAAIGFWPLAALAGLQLLVGLTLGRRFCLPCVLYFELIQPRLGEGELEDARAPRFANAVGCAVLAASTLSSLAGAPLVGRGLAGLVAALALLAAVTGICVGCELYRIGTRLRGIGSARLARLDPSDFGAMTDGTVVHFTHPLCGACRHVERRLRADGRELVVVDVRERPDLARKYRVGVVPTTVAVSRSGTVLARLG